MIERMTRIVEGERFTFEWHGGEYIEVGQTWDKPMEVINVWDSDKNQPRIPRTRAAFRKKVDEWIEEYGPKELVHDARFNWIV